ncbi:MAG: hypothetical protein V4608_10355 [Bacteroidota bacterium]
MKTHFNLHSQKLPITFLLAFFSLAAVGQNANIAGDVCGCNSIMKNDSTQKFTGKDETGLYSNGKIKYKITKKGKKEHAIFYNSTGLKCKEEFLNYRTNIKKTIFYNSSEKKQMVCKGTLKL